MTGGDGSPAALRAAIEADFVETRMTPSEAPVEVHRDGDVSWTRNDLPLAFLNIVAATRLGEAAADQRIGTILSAYMEFGVPGLWWIGPNDRPTDLAARLEAQGVPRLGDSPGMAIDLAELPDRVDGPADLSIEPVVDAVGLDAFLGVVAAAIGDERSTPEVFAAYRARALPWISGRLGAEAVPLRYVGRIDGEPVGSARLSFAGGVAGLYTVTTLPALRGRGIGRAMSLAALLEARRAGHRIGVLQSSPLGRPVYRRLGFRKLLRFTVFGWQGTDAGGP